MIFNTCSPVAVAVLDLDTKVARDHARVTLDSHLTHSCQAQHSILVRHVFTQVLGVVLVRVVPIRVQVVEERAKKNLKIFIDKNNKFKNLKNFIRLSTDLCTFQISAIWFMFANVNGGVSLVGELMNASVKTLVKVYVKPEIMPNAT